MRGFVPTPGTTAHDHFFDSFARFGRNIDESRHLGEWLDELATRAAAQNEQYLELMHTPDFRHAAALAKELGWPDPGDSPAAFSKLRDELLAHGLREEVATASAALDQAEKRSAVSANSCGQKDEAPACRRANSVSLPGLARLSEGAGFRANAARLRNRFRRSPLRRHQYGDARRRLHFHVRLRPANANGRLPSRRFTRRSTSACTLAKSRRAWLPTKVSAATFASRSKRATPNASATAWT